MLIWILGFSIDHWDLLISICSVSSVGIVKFFISLILKEHSTWLFKSLILFSTSVPCFCPSLRDTHIFIFKNSFFQHPPLHSCLPLLQGRWQCSPVKNGCRSQNAFSLTCFIWVRNSSKNFCIYWCKTYLTSSSYIILIFICLLSLPGML